MLLGTTCPENNLPKVRETTTKDGGNGGTIFLKVDEKFGAFEVA